MKSINERLSKIQQPCRCPRVTCGRPVGQISKVQEPDGEVGFWGECSCGIIFNLEQIQDDMYDAKYRDGYDKMKNATAIGIHAMKIYMPIIMESTMGRKMLEVGYNTDKTREYCQASGWVYYGLEKNKEAIENDRMFKGDFEDYDFGHTKFNLIWMSHVLEHFKNPEKVLLKCHQMLTEDGCLFIATPDIDFIKNKGIDQWGHWNRKEHNILWNGRSLEEDLQRMGFSVIIKKRNHSMRFTSWDDIQILSQKIYV